MQIFHPLNTIHNFSPIKLDKSFVDSQATMKSGNTKNNPATLARLLTRILQLFIIAMLAIAWLSIITKCTKAKHNWHRRH